MGWLTEQPIAHRGLHRGDEVPENSMAAYEKALGRGCPIELDVHLLSDGKIAVFHDDNLERMTAHEGIIWEHSSGDIRPLRLRGTDQQIPLLEDVLDLVGDKVPLLIEIKNKLTVGPLESLLSKTLRAFKGMFAVQSFNPLSLEWFKANDPGVARGQLSGDFRDADLAFYKKFLLRRLLLNPRSEPDFIAYDHRCLPNFWVNRERNRRKIPLLAWTVATQEAYDTVAPLVDNVIFENLDF